MSEQKKIERLMRFCGVDMEALYEKNKNTLRALAELMGCDPDDMYKESEWAKTNVDPIRGKTLSQGQYIDSEGKECRFVTKEINGDYAKSQINKDLFTQKMNEKKEELQALLDDNPEKRWNQKYLEMQEMIERISKESIIEEKDISHTCTNIANYGLLNVGDTFDFGRYNGKPIKWKILKKGDDSIYVISTEKICKKQFNDELSIYANNWIGSDIRKWLNIEFYQSAFSANEKVKIGTVESDKVALLSKEEAESLMTMQERSINSWWWLRTAGDSMHFVSCVLGDGTIDDIGYVSSELAARPTLNLKL